MEHHGLAVEIEVEKRLGFSGKQQIEAYGIAAFNQACLDPAVHHLRAPMARAMTERIGYWLDLDHPYLTYSKRPTSSRSGGPSPSSPRAACSTRGTRSSPTARAVGTTLSSHEVAQNYKDADDPSIWTLFHARPGQSIPTTTEGESWDTGDNFYLVAGPPPPGRRSPTSASRCIPS